MTDSPVDPGTASADSPPGGGRGSYLWIVALVAVAAFLLVTYLIITA